MQDALNGAGDILAERISDNADYRKRLRQMTIKNGSITAEARDEKEASVYEMYYHFSEPVNKVAGHRVLALNRGRKRRS